MPSMWIVEPHVAVNNAQVLRVARKSFYGEFVADNNKTCRLKKICPASFRETCQWLKFALIHLGQITKQIHKLQRR